MKVKTQDAGRSCKLADRVLHQKCVDFDFLEYIAE